MKSRKNMLIRYFLLISGIVVLALIGMESSADTIIVDKGGGGDYLNIQGAIDDSNWGDTIYVKEGTYFENVVVDKRVTLTGERNDTTIIDGGNAIDVLRVPENFVNISGFRIVNSGTGYSGIRLEANNISVFDVISTENDQGIFISEGISNIRIERNNIFGNRIGIRAYGTHDIMCNNIYDNTEQGIDAHDNSGCLVYVGSNWHGDSTGPYNANNNSGGKGDSVTDYIHILGWVTDPIQVENTAPAIELRDPIPSPEVPLFKARPNLMWKNEDLNIWDHIPGAMRYTLFIDTDQMKVSNMEPDARSAVFIQGTTTSVVVDPVDSPVGSIYYWGIFAEDRYGLTTYESGGAFKYDSEVPSVHNITAMSVNDDIDDPLPIGEVRVFGPGYENSQGEKIGRPVKFAISMSDNLGLRFSNNHIAATQLYMDEYYPPATVFSVKVLYFYGGQYESDLPNFNLYVDEEGMNNDLESLTGQPAVTFYMIPDGPIPDGMFHFYVQAADEVRWGSYLDWTFGIDLTAPDTPVDIIIDPQTYVDQFDELYLKAGEFYTLSVTGPSSAEDSSMNRVEFQQAAANYPGATWETIGTDYDVSDNTYSVLWTPDTEHYYLRAIAYDYIDNYAISDVFTNFHVDGWGPVEPLTLQATLDLTHSPKAQISGYVYDRIVEDQTSGVDFVVLWHCNNASGTMELIEDDEGKVVKIPVIDYQFHHEVDLETVSATIGDISYSFIAQADDNVGNPGNMSEMCMWTNTGLRDSMRVISPSTIKDIPMTQRNSDPDDSLDELRLVSVTFLNTEQDFMSYLFTIREQPLRTSSDASAIGLPQYTTFLYGCYNVEVPPEFTNFEAQVTIEFHISSPSPLGPTINDILDNINFMARHSGEDSYEVLELIGGQPQPVDEIKGIYRVQARMNRFSDFVITVTANFKPTAHILGIDPRPASEGKNITFTASAEDDGSIAAYHWTSDIDGELYNGSQSTFSLDSLSGGTHTIRLRVLDDGGLWSDSVSTDLFVKSAPVVNEVTVTPNPAIKGDDITLSANVTHTSDIEKFYWRSSRDYEIYYGPESTIIVSDLSVGTHIIFFMAKDYHESWSAEVMVTLIVDADTEAPTMTIMSHGNGNKVKDTVSISGEAADNANIRKIEYRIDGSGNWLQANGTTTWSIELDTTLLEDGKHTLEIRAFDGTHYSDPVNLTLRIDNEGGSDDSFLFEEIGPLPLIGVLAIIAVILLGGIAVVNKNSRGKDGAESQRSPPFNLCQSSLPPSPPGQPISSPQGTKTSTPQPPVLYSPAPHSPTPHSPAPQSPVQQSTVPHSPAPQPPVRPPPGQQPRYPQVSTQQSPQQAPLPPPPSIRQPTAPSQSQPRTQSRPFRQMRYQQPPPHAQQRSISQSRPQSRPLNDALTQETPHQLSTWKCPSCGSITYSDFQFCMKCGYRRGG